MTGQRCKKLHHARNRYECCWTHCGASQICQCKAPFLADGDGGNELRMGKRYNAIVNSPQIADGEKIGCVVAADHLIAASGSNWGGYALAAAAALINGRGRRCCHSRICAKMFALGTRGNGLLGTLCSRDGVSGKMELTVDGMPLETSLQCLRDIRATALGKETTR